MRIIQRLRMPGLLSFPPDMGFFDLAPEYLYENAVADELPPVVEFPVEAGAGAARGRPLNGRA